MVDAKTISLLRNSITASAVIAIAASVCPHNANSATVPEPLDFHELAFGGARATIASNLRQLTRPLAKQRDRAANPLGELSPLGERLLALRRAAIAAGMRTRPADQILEEFRAARDA